MFPSKGVRISQDVLDAVADVRTDSSETNWYDEGFVFVYQELMNHLRSAHKLLIYNNIASYPGSSSSSFFGGRAWVRGYNNVSMLRLWVFQERVCWLNLWVWMCSYCYGEANGILIGQHNESCIALFILQR